MIAEPFLSKFVTSPNYKTGARLMSKGLKIVLIILGAYLTIASLHVWLNIGFGELGLTGTKKAETFRVGFLPVT